MREAADIGNIEKDQKLPSVPLATPIELPK
jgi:hypothetical protein